MAAASGVGIQFILENIPFVSGALKYAQLRTFPGGASDNRDYFGPRVHFTEDIPDEKQMLLFDPQTSGGLLMAVPQSKQEAFLKRAEEINLPAWAVGKAIEGEGIRVV
jgi:selenide,water dikinase